MFGEALLRLVVAATFTALIGIDRELRAKPAGLRTNVLVGAAAATFAFVGAELFPGADPSRVAAQIVTGIGFLGGGAIFAAGARPVGLTTAAALWGAAAVGTAAGIGAFAVAGALVIVTMVALIPMDWVVARLLEEWGVRDLRVQVLVADVGGVRAVRELLDRHGFRAHPVELREVGGHVVVELLVHARPSRLRALVAELEARGDLTFIADETPRT